MSSFSSVIQKPGKKIVPKAAPRRNVPRRLGPTSTSASDISQPDEVHSERPSEQSPRSSAPAISEVETEENEQQQSGVIETSQHRNDSETSRTVHQSDQVPVLLSQVSPIGVSGVAQENREQPESERAAVNDVSVSAPSEALPVPPISEVSDASNAVVVTDEIVSSNSNSEPTVDASAASTGTRQQSQDLEDAVPRQLRKRKTIIHTETPSSPQKRRKSASRAGSETTSPVSTHAVPGAPLRQTSSSPSNHSVLPADLLQSATQRAASVSQLANSIESQIRSLRPHPEQQASSETTDVGEANASRISSSQPARAKRSRRKGTAQEQAEEVIANVVGGPSTSARRRGITPEGAETHQLEPAKVTMGELCEDNRLGKKSALETEMQANWAEILERRKEDRMRALENAEKRSRKSAGQKHVLNENQEPVVALAPAMTVVNGVIVVDQSSREIDRAAQLQQAAAQDLDNVREDRDYYKYVNQGTVGMKSGRGRHAKWDEESTERFFKGLRMFGTDFLMIANMFPGVSRKQIKSKFIREENADKFRVMDCLRNREPVQLDDYAQMANKDTEEFHTLESIQKELDEQERRLREEDNERRRREGFAAAEDGDDSQPVPAVEGEQADRQQTESTEPNRFNALAQEVIDAAVAPRKRQRKSNTTNRRGQKGGKQPEGGVEEVLGNIHEVAV